MTQYQKELKSAQHRMVLLVRELMVKLGLRYVEVQNLCNEAIDRVMTSPKLYDAPKEASE